MLTNAIFKRTVKARSNRREYCMNVRFYKIFHDCWLENWKLHILCKFCATELERFTGFTFIGNAQTQIFNAKEVQVLEPCEAIAIYAKEKRNIRIARSIEGQLCQNCLVWPYNLYPRQNTSYHSSIHIKCLYMT